MCDCKELLTYDGVLVIEYPDILSIIDSWNNKNSTYGDPPDEHKLVSFIFSHNRNAYGDYGYHKSGYTVKILSELLEECGYIITKVANGTMHGRRYRDKHIEARKGQF